MTISNAIPVQFWLNGQQVFNEKIEDGIEPKSFYQKFNKDDSVKLQFTDTVSKVYKLTIFSCDDEQLAQLDFTSELVESEYVYSLEFDFETEGIDSGLVWLQISEFAYSFSVSGALTDLMDEVTGTMTFIPASLIFEIEGDIEDLMDEAAGDVEILGVISVLNSSTDVIITGVEVNGIAVTHSGGTNFPISTGNNGQFTTKETGVVNIEVFYSATTDPQRITLEDSLGANECDETVTGGPADINFISVTVLPTPSPEAIITTIEALDGSC